jgi:acid stress-induced BolA-like protein IbaG/YrbA
MAANQLTQKELKELLARRLKLKSPVFHLEKAGNFIIGDIISLTFKGKDDLRRQKMIWDALESKYGRDATRWVGMLLAYTPDEWDFGNSVETEISRRKKAG